MRELLQGGGGEGGERELSTPLHQKYITLKNNLLVAQNRTEYIHCARPQCHGIVTLQLNHQEQSFLSDNAGNSSFSMTLRPCNTCGMLTCRMCGESALIDAENAHVCVELEDALDEQYNIMKSTSNHLVGRCP